MYYFCIHFSCCFQVHCIFAQVRNARAEARVKLTYVGALKIRFFSEKPDCFEFKSVVQVQSEIAVVSGCARCDTFHSFPGEISLVWIFAPKKFGKTKFRQDDSESSFDSTKIRERLRNFVEFSREQGTKSAEFRLHFFCTVL